MSTTVPPANSVTTTPVPGARLSAQVSKPDAQVERGKNLYPNGIDWPVSLWLISLHVGALFAPFTFTMPGLILALVLHWVTGGLGICLGYHRLFTHTSFKTYRPVRWMLALIGGLAGEGGVDDWVSIHRAHHAMSDQVGDPHSPRDGKWWSHMLWIGRARPDRDEFNKRWAPDMSRDPVLSFICRRFLSSHIVFGLLILGGATWCGGLQFGASVTVWAIFVRLCAVLHVTWMVNSVTHMWGYRNYETTDDSRNNWLVALLGYGEGWHNNHHAYPRMANHGHRWWEFDVTYRTIRACALVGLVWDVVDYRNQSEKA
jgi:stearoyl-CoA desaturase (delta-9 desaturase)